MTKKQQLLDVEIMQLTKNEQRKRSKSIFLGLLVVSILSLSICLVYANEGEEFSILNDSYERDVKIVVEENYAKIESELKYNETKDEFKIEIRTEPFKPPFSSDFLEFKLEYESKLNESKEVDLEFKVSFFEIVEYVDQNGNGAYEPNEDNIISIYKLENFAPISYTNSTGENGTIHVLEIETIDKVFLARIYAVGDFADINGQTIHPAQIKIDIEINNFAYNNEESALALLTKIESTEEMVSIDETEDEKQGRAKKEKGIQVNAEEYTGFFTWDEYVIVDGEEMTVSATELTQEENEQKLYLNYPRGIEIVHDPKIGIAGIVTQQEEEEEEEEERPDKKELTNFEGLFKNHKIDIHGFLGKYEPIINYFGQIVVPTLSKNIHFVISTVATLFVAIFVVISKRRKL